MFNIFQVTEKKEFYFILYVIYISLQSPIIFQIVYYNLVNNLLYK